MSESSVFPQLIGTIAAEKGLLTFSQLEEALNEQSKSKQNIGQILIDKKFITQDQLGQILALQEEVNVRKEEYLFGHLAIKNKFVTASEINTVLEKQKYEKFRRSIGEILVSDNLLNQQQCNALLKAQSRILKSSSKDEIVRKKIFCPKCKQQYTIPDPDRYRKVKCKKCKYIFEAGIKELQIISSDSSNDQSNKTFNIDESKSLQDYLAQNKINPMADLNNSVTDSLKEGNARYIIGSEIARGGMGAILSTKDTNLRRNIVTKILIKNTSRIATLRFIEEAQITGQLEHPNIPPVYDLGLNKLNKLYFTMKHIKGETLESIIRKLKAEDQETKNNYDYTTLINIFIKVADALSYAHNKRVIHRDIKPENIMVGAYGEVLLMDWGLAKIIGTKEEFEELDEQAEISTVRSEDESSNTIAGTTAGTPTFMSPEQAAGYMDELDARSDIYSLGSTLYNALSLQRPVSGNSLQSVLVKVANGEYDPLPESIPEELRAITYKAMKLQKEDRYKTVEEFQQDLKKYLLGYSVSAKRDTILDLIKKFYKRNKLLASITTIGTGIVITSTTFFTIQLNKQYNEALSAKISAEKNLEKFNLEQKMRNEDNKKAAPTYYSKALDEVSRGDLTTAFHFAQTASEYDSDNIDYIYLKALIALHTKKVSLAKKSFALCLNHKTYNKKASNYLKFIDTYKNLSNKKDFIDQLVKVDKSNNENQIGVHFEGELINKIRMWAQDFHDNFGKKKPNISLDDDNLVQLTLSQHSSDLDLSYFSNYPIESINIYYSKTTNINFLKNMPITKLAIYQCANLTDISIIKTLPLIELSVNSTLIKNMDFISHLNLKKLRLITAPISSFDIIKNMPLEYLSLTNIKIENFEGFEKLPIKAFEFKSSVIKDLSPISKSKTLEEIDLTYTIVNVSEQLAQLKARKLIINSGKIDLTHLNNGTLEYLSLKNSSITHFERLNSFKKLKYLTFSPNKTSENWEEVLKSMENQLESIGETDNDASRATNLKDFKAILQSKNIK